MSPVAIFAIAVALPIVQIDPLTPVGALTEGLQAPIRLAITSDTVFVADPIDNVIVRFDLAGTPLGVWSVPEGPVGVAVHPDGRVFVARRDDAQVAVYDSAFTFLHFLGAGVVSFTKPTDLALDATTGRIYVVDSGADRFYAFDSSGSLVLMAGIRGDRLGETKYPSAIAIDPATGRIMVGDQDNFRVQVFASSGLFEFRFGYRNKYMAGGGSEGWVARTAGLAVDAAGNIYVVDALMGTLRIFDSTGTDLGKAVEFGTDPGDLQTPCDVALDPTGRVFVANSHLGRVDIYAPPSLLATGGTGAASSGDKNAPADGVETQTPGWDPPHMLDDVICGRCHSIDGQPGGHEGTVDGQANLCFSCHTGGGQALASLIRPTTDRGMSHAWGAPAVNAAFGSVGPAPGGVMEPRLENGNIKCATCHDQHNNDAASPFLRAAADALCQECHAEHVRHTPEGTWQPACTECHQAHDARHRNLSLVNASVHNRTLSQDKTVVFTAQTGTNSFSDGDPAANDGICQVCHTATNYHRHDGTGASHNEGADCTSCHPHDAGFMPVGGDCTGCHAAPQDNGDGLPVGGRRPVVAEFPAADAHAHYGIQLDSGACTVCHDQTTHMDGYVDLIDPDTGGLLTFLRPDDLTSDPDLSDFCAGCHDNDGAGRLADPFDPFGIANVPTDVATRFQGTLQWNEWYGDFCFGNEGTNRAVNSHHDISDADQAFSGAKLECLNCHGAHAAGESQPLIDPFDPVSSSPWTGGDNEFCLSCHAGGNGPVDPGFPSSVIGPTVALRGIDSCDYTQQWWYVDYTWTHSAHGLDSKRGWNGYSGAPSYEMGCMDCHDPHGSYTDTNTTGNPYMIRDHVDGTMYVDDGTRTGGWTGSAGNWNVYGTSREVVVTVNGTDVDWGSNTSLCGTCHATWLAAYDWHSYCNGCQTCHGHGMAFGEYDFVDPRDDTYCPLPPAAAGQAITAGSAGVQYSIPLDRPLHLQAGK